jgi:transposase
MWSFTNVEKQLLEIETDNNHKGYGMLKLFKCLLLQFMEDVSDRELERLLQENNAAKWFCNFSLAEETPNYSVFSRARSKIGTNQLSKIFADLRGQLKSQGIMCEVFSFVDATHLIAKASFWDERNKAIEQSMRSLTMRYCLKLLMINKLG